MDTSNLWRNDLDEGLYPYAVALGALLAQKLKKKRDRLDTLDIQHITQETLKVSDIFDKIKFVAAKRFVWKIPVDTPCAENVDPAVWQAIMAQGRDTYTILLGTLEEYIVPQIRQEVASHYPSEHQRMQTLKFLRRFMQSVVIEYEYRLSLSVSGYRPIHVYGL